MATQITDLKATKIDGTPVQMQDYEGKVLLIVNVASKCGLTPQYDGLEALYQRYQEQGFEVLGFPANEFLGQEPGDNQEIQEFCKANFGVQFPMFEKVVVKGEKQHPLFQRLTYSGVKRQKAPGSGFEEKLRSKGLLGENESDIQWNFEKFLVNRKGEVVARFAPDVLPEDHLLTHAIEEELQKS